MNAPEWINGTLTDFGHLMGLTDFRLNANGVASLKIENGLRFSFEYANGALVVSVLVAMDRGATSLCRLLAQSNPFVQGGLVQGRPVRTYYLAKSGEGGCALSLAEIDIKVNTLEQAFQALWNAADYLRRNAGWR